MINTKGIISDNGKIITVLNAGKELEETYKNFIAGTAEDYELVSSGEGCDKFYDYKYSIFFDKKTLTSFTISCKSYKPVRNV